MAVTHRDLRALELANRHIGIKQELEEYHRFADTLLYLNEGLKEAKTQIAYWQKYSETLLIKISFHAFTLHQIFSGLVLSSHYYPKEINGKKVIDRSSAIAILRSQLETFLMYKHIYVNPKNNDEKELRYQAWIYASLFQRQNFPSSTNYAKQQKEKDAKELSLIKNNIKTLNSFKILSQKQQNALLSSGSGKLFKHWAAILLESGYDEKHAFSVNYGYWSSYSHAEGLSAIQLDGSSFAYNDYDKRIISDIHSSKMILCIMIIILKEAFIVAEIKYNTLPDELRYDIEFFDNLAKRTKFK